MVVNQERRASRTTSVETAAVPMCRDREVSGPEQETMDKPRLVFFYSERDGALAALNGRRRQRPSPVIGGGEMANPAPGRKRRFSGHVPLH
jgi:hypothetical protein